MWGHARPRRSRRQLSRAGPCSPPRRWCSAGWRCPTWVSATPVRSARAGAALGVAHPTGFAIDAAAAAVRVAAAARQHRVAAKPDRRARGGGGARDARAQLCDALALRLARGRRDRARRRCGVRRARPRHVAYLPGHGDRGRGVLARAARRGARRAGGLRAAVTRGRRVLARARAFARLARHRRAAIASAVLWARGCTRVRSRARCARACRWLRRRA